MNNVLNNRWLQLVLRLVIGGVFVYAGASKLQNPQAFADSIATFQLLPNELINIVALALPLFEVIAGALLIVGWQRKAMAFCILVLTGMFAVFLIQAIARGLQVDCGCFGSGAPSVAKTWMSLGRDILLLAGAWLIYRPRAIQRTASSTRSRCEREAGSAAAC